jgi:putative transposase
MHDDDFPCRNARCASHCPPDWVPASATFFLTINCRQRGANQLANPSIAAGIVDALNFYHQSSRWHVELAMIMPDHLHMLISFTWDPGDGMMALIRNWKRYTANHLGIVWQRDYFDHRIRSENDHQSTWFYIRENPVRAGLVGRFEKWPFIWRPEHGMGW